MKIEEIKEFNEDFAEAMNIFANWWGVEKNISLEEITKEYKNTLFKSTLPKIFVLKDNDAVIGVYELKKNDNIPTDEYEPYLASVFIKEEYRGNGYSKILISSAKEETEKLGYKTLYLHSRQINLYEKYGFEYIRTIDTEYGPKRIFKFKIKE